MLFRSPLSPAVCLSLSVSVSVSLSVSVSVSVSLYHQSADEQTLGRTRQSQGMKGAIESQLVRVFEAYAFSQRPRCLAASTFSSRRGRILPCWISRSTFAITLSSLYQALTRKAWLRQALVAAAGNSNGSNGGHTSGFAHDLRG